MYIHDLKMQLNEYLLYTYMYNMYLRIFFIVIVGINNLFYIIQHFLFSLYTI